MTDRRQEAERYRRLAEKYARTALMTTDARTLEALNGLALQYRHAAKELEWELEAARLHDEISECAYFLWLDEGEPEGQADQHWERARTIVHQRRFS